EAEICEDSFSAVAGLAWTAPPSGSARLALGDAFAVTPPFTGNGMAMALQSAAGALPFLLAWSQGEVSWEETRRQVHRALHRRFRRRLRHARHVHLWLLSPAATRLAGFLHRRGWVPWRLFYRLVH